MSNWKQRGIQVSGFVPEAIEKEIARQLASLEIDPSRRLDEAADEAHRRFMAGHWEAHKCASQIIVHCLCRLAMSDEVNDRCWVALLPAQPTEDDVLRCLLRLGAWARPAMADSAAWRMSAQEVAKLRNEIRDMAAKLLARVRVAYGADVSIHGVAEVLPEFRPLALALAWRERETFKESMRESLDEMPPVASALFAGHCAAQAEDQTPRLSHFLTALVRGAEDSELYDELHAQRHGLWGAYPRRHDALRLAVTRSIAEEMLSQPGCQSAPIAPIVQQVLDAWFDKRLSTTQINREIRDIRSNAAMRRYRTNPQQASR